MLGVRVACAIACAWVIGCAGKTPATDVSSNRRDAVASNGGSPGPQASLADECDALIAPINEILVDIHRIAARRSAPKQAVVDFQELEALYEKLENRLVSMQFERNELTGFKSEYVAMTRRAQRTLHDIAGALHRNDHARAKKVQAEFGSLIALEESIVDRINAYCAEPVQEQA